MATIIEMPSLGGKLLGPMALATGKQHFQFAAYVTKGIWIGTPKPLDLLLN